MPRTPDTNGPAEGAVPVTSATTIAAAPFDTSTTDRAYVSAVLTKLDPRDRVRAVVLTYKNGLVPAARGRKPT